MRIPFVALLAPLALGACRPSATVERTTPVANLQTYRSVIVRVGAARDAGALEEAVTAALRTRCALAVFASSQGVDPAADLQLDLTIQRAGRGGDSLLQNPNQATIDVLVVLSDRVDGELIGSAVVKGRSPAVLVDGSVPPEQQAIEVVGRTIGEVLGSSGCAGPRLARAEPAAPAPGPEANVTPAVFSGPDAGPAAGGEPGGDEPAPPASGPSVELRREADAANEAGKQKFRTGAPGAALDDFRRAMMLVRDPRYGLNICLAHEALEQWDAATAACREVLTMRPPEAVATKARQRLEIIRQRRSV